MPFFDVLFHEEIIWKSIYRSEAVLGDKGLAFYHPSMPKIPHWNIFYPHSDTALTRDDLVQLLDFYESKGIEGHFLARQPLSSNLAVSEDEFFFQPARVTQKPKANLEVKRAFDLNEFGKVVKDVFAMDEKFSDDLQNQLQRASEQGIDARHYLVSCDGKLCGSFSLFKASDDFDFRMNLGLLPAFRNRGLSTCLSLAASLQSPRRLMTHTNHPLLRQKVLPATGFQSVGEANVIPLRKILEAR